MTTETNHLLQQIDSIKSALDTHRPFPDHVVKQLKDYYRIGLTFTSNAIEGNTLTESETKVVIEDGITIGGKSLREHNEAIGHANAYDHIYSLLNRTITEDDVLFLHKLFYQQINTEIAGKYRQRNLIITGTDYLPPDYSEVHAIMKRHIESINGNAKDKHPLEHASDLHAEFEAIHPFIDGNGRIGRLLLSIMTMKNCHSPVIVPPARRAEYITGLQKTNKGDVYTLRAFILSVIHEELKSLQKLVEHLIK